MLRVVAHEVTKPCLVGGTGRAAYLHAALTIQKGRLTGRSPCRLQLLADRRLGGPTGADPGLEASEIGSLKVNFLLRDRDATVTTTFDEVFKSRSVKVIRGHPTVGRFFKSNGRAKLLVVLAILPS